MARVGGDEFYILLLEPTRIDLDRRLDRLRVLVENGLYVSNLDKPLGLSAGGAIWRPGDDAYQILAAADAEMYAVKTLHKLTNITTFRSASRIQDVA
ncbi:diguanylate cyclase [uncultured Aureimonas sp.]|uniref:diguanylate cyclase domain-containing protein n=1 Tax=uncultured Aureimonas sp. TaxID=1604662 RepID=UPI0025FCD1E9|nr:diguanylate cyclase [uncultured Aureimonas sp.]